MTLPMSIAIEKMRIDFYDIERSQKMTKNVNFEQNARIFDLKWFNCRVMASILTGRLFF
jgi:hypothetical protein